MKVPYTMCGKCDGMVYQNSPHGQLCYPAFRPFNPRTEAQTAVRKNFGGMGQLWNPLSDWQRQLWDQEGATKRTRKRLGQSWPMAGWNYFVQVNQRRLNRGLPPLAFPPGYFQRLEAALAAAIAAAGSTQPLLGPALFLQANRLPGVKNAAVAAVPAGRPPPG